MDRQAREDFDRLNPIDPPQPATLSGTEYVIETRNGVQYAFDAEEVEEFYYVNGNITVQCFDPDSTVVFKSPDVVRWFVRSTP